MNKKDIIVLSISPFLVTVGALSALLLHSLIKTKAVEEEEIDLSESFEETYAQYKTLNKEDYLTTFDDVDIVNIALLNVENSEQFYATTKGEVVALGVKQSINGLLIKDDKNLFEEDLSYSRFVKAANRFYQDEEKVTWYKGKYESHIGHYEDCKITEYTHDAFLDKWGRTLNTGSIYTINHKTLIESKRENSGEDTYLITLELNPKLSTLNYIKQMKITGNLKADPVFKKVTLSFVIDDNLYLKSLSTNETYSTFVWGIDASNTKGTLTQDFYYEHKDIPSLEEPINYE